MEIKLDISTVAATVDLLLNGPGALDKPTHAFILVVLPDIQDDSADPGITAAVMSNLTPAAAANALQEVLRTNAMKDELRPN